MWCSTECWDCEDKTCEHYKSKLDLYFENKKLTNNWNELKQHIKEYLEEWENSDDEWVKGKCDMARDILDRIMSEDLIAWENCYDPCQMRYTIKGRLLIGAPKGRNTWMRGNLREEKS
jgi:hypothetical protein